MVIFAFGVPLADGMKSAMDWSSERILPKAIARPTAMAVRGFDSDRMMRSSVAVVGLRRGFFRRHIQWLTSRVTAPVSA